MWWSFWLRIFALCGFCRWATLVWCKFFFMSVWDLIWTIDQGNISSNMGWLTMWNGHEKWKSSTYPTLIYTAWWWAELIKVKKKEKCALVQRFLIKLPSTFVDEPNNKVPNYRNKWKRKSWFTSSIFCLCCSSFLCLIDSSRWLTRGPVIHSIMQHDVKAGEAAVGTERSIIYRLYMFRYSETSLCVPISTHYWPLV